MEGNDVVFKDYNNIFLSLRHHPNGTNFSLAESISGTGIDRDETGRDRSEIGIDTVI